MRRESQTGGETLDGTAVYRRMIDGIDTCALFACDRSGSITTWNRGVETLLGYREHEFVGRDASMLLAAGDAADGLAERERAAARDGRAVSLRRWHRRKDGSVFWGDGSIVALRDGVDVIGYAVIVRDDGERRRLEAELAEAARQKDRFLAAVSHELRTPLMAILGWIRVLQDGELAAEELATALTTIERNALLQRRLIEDLIDCARLVSGTLEIDRAPVDLRDVVERRVTAQRATAGEKELAIEARVGAERLIVDGDAERIDQVLGNLLSNAIKFTLAGGSITVELRRNGADAELVVRDTGVGIEPEYLPGLFARAAGNGPLDESGVGLGLWIVRELVGLHRGTIVAASDGIGRGSTFTVRLPLRAAG